MGTTISKGKNLRKYLGSIPMPSPWLPPVLAISRLTSMWSAVERNCPKIHTSYQPIPWLPMQSVTTLVSSMVVKNYIENTSANQIVRIFTDRRRLLLFVCICLYWWLIWSSSKGLGSSFHTSEDQK